MNSTHELIRLCMNDLDVEYIIVSNTKSSYIMYMHPVFNKVICNYGNNFKQIDYKTLNLDGYMIVKKKLKNQE